jgi:hypothetical protein
VSDAGARQAPSRAAPGPQAHPGGALLAGTTGLRHGRGCSELGQPTGGLHLQLLLQEQQLRLLLHHGLLLRGRLRNGLLLRLLLQQRARQECRAGVGRGARRRQGGQRYWQRRGQCECGCESSRMLACGRERVELLCRQQLREPRVGGAGAAGRPLLPRQRCGGHGQRHSARRGHGGLLLLLLLLQDVQHAQELIAGLPARSRRHGANGGDEPLRQGLGG